MVSEETIFSSFDFVALRNVVLVLANQLGQEKNNKFQGQDPRVRERERARERMREISKRTSESRRRESRSRQQGRDSAIKIKRGAMGRAQF